jgi:hypothetical protein
MEGVLMKSHHLEAIMVKRAQVTQGNQVRYRVYQSPAEFIAVIAESALLAIRISGVQDPYKVVRDLPTSGVAIEKGLLNVPEGSEKVAIPMGRMDNKALTAIVEKHVSDDDNFIALTLPDLHKKKVPTAMVLSREVAMQMFGISENTPTLARPPLPLPEPISVAPPEPVAKGPDEALSQEEITRLLGDA